MTANLDPEARDLLDVIHATGESPVYTLSVADARERTRAIARNTSLSLDVEDILLPAPTGALRLRLHRPSDGPLPVALFLHGGGWTLHDVRTNDEVCQRLAKRSGWLFASLDYRLAPEHKYPAAIEDAYRAFRWLTDNAASIGCHSTCHAVVGESSGGTIAASLTLLLRDCGAPMPCGQIVAYPAMAPLDGWPSYTERGSGYVLDRSLMEWFFGHYLPPTWNERDPYLFPLAEKDFSGLPPTLVVTAEFDPLRDEGIAYVRKLVDAGVSVEHLHADDQMHGFLQAAEVITKARAVSDRLADALACWRAQYTSGAAVQKSGTVSKYRPSGSLERASTNASWGS